MEDKNDDYVVAFERNPGHPTPAVRMLKVVVSATSAEDAIAKAKKELSLNLGWTITRVCSVIVTQAYARPEQA